MITFIAFLFLFLLSALFSATEIAYFSLRPSRVKILGGKNGTKSGKLVRKHLDAPDELLITILIGNNVVNVYPASLATLVATRLFGSAGIGVATGAVTLLLLLFGEITPKAFAQRNNEWLAMRIAPVLEILRIALMPVVWILRHVTKIILRPFKLSEVEKDLISKEELSELTNLAKRSGSVEQQEHELIEKVLAFSDKKIKDVLIPLHKVVSLNAETPVEQIAHFVAQSGYSRYPIFEDEKNNLIGYLHVNDIMKKLNSDDREALVGTLARKFSKVPVDATAGGVFRKMRRKHEHVVLVRGSRKQPLGIITLEDILEELHGEIIDEVDSERDSKK